VFTGLKPTGRLQLGNLLGALRPMVQLAADPADDVTVCVVDLHALTVEHGPATLAARTLELATTVLACGLPDDAALFVQSALPAHSELSYLLESTATYGEMHRMIQFREKGGGVSARLSLLTYPALMAADVLLHRADVVPVGEDQRQHLELTTTLARRFNHRYGDVFTVPRGIVAEDGARLMDLRDPTSKMGKSGADGSGVLFLLDDVDTLVATVRRAVTDADPVLTYDPAGRPGVTNLAVLLGALTGRPPQRVLDGLHGAAALKAAVAEAVVSTLAPVQARYRELAADPAHVLARLAAGRADVQPGAQAVLDDARRAIGLLA
jgi:tryptophanyl-tRNA synthetase